MSAPASVPLLQIQLFSVVIGLAVSSVAAILGCLSDANCLQDPYALLS